jgi:hypothetical protein
LIWLTRQFLILLTDLGLNIWAGARFAVFIPVKRESFRVTFAQALLLLLVSFCLSYAYDYFGSIPENYFNIYGLYYQATLYLLFFFSIILIARLQNNFSSLLTAIIMFQAIVPAISLIYICLLHVSEYQTMFDQGQMEWTVFVIYLAWYLIIIFRLLDSIYQMPVSRGFILLGLYTVINIPPMIFMPNQPLWYAYINSSQEQDKKFNLDVEDTYYAQTKLLNSSASKLLQQRPGIIDLYFLGFAGDANEDVFMNEVSHVKSLFDERFDTRGRSMLLVNNAKTVQTHPLANLHNLNFTLNNIATRMDIEEDILFLFLTSHGSEDHKLAVNFSTMQMNDINPESIRFALENAGIKWSIIIISACYSGAFINSLEDDHTLVITASSGDRNSFGCGHDGDFTYFGEAYFDKYLKYENSFISAFHLASKEIENREKKEDKDHSYPQIFIGKGIEKKLNVFFNQIEQAGKNNWSMSKQ